MPTTQPPDKPKRHTAPVKRVHTADGSTCTHPIAPTGSPRTSKCPGKFSYTASCWCGWSASSGLRTITEDNARGHRTR
ncbi:hypothetical protein ACIPJN_29790 [Streptomyces sp. NPDC086796]|uniref:hypothetical protein n=1 Tax=Streptomyces sp. NPDC086796 TaxID=3365760 RepID=UPI003812F3EB